MNATEREESVRILAKSKKCMVMLCAPSHFPLRVELTLRRLQDGATSPSLACPSTRVLTLFVRRA